MTKRAFICRVGAFALTSAIALSAMAYDDPVDAYDEAVRNQAAGLPVPGVPSVPSVPSTPSNPVSNGLELYINGKHVAVSPYYQGGTLMVSLRSVTDRANYNYSYSNGFITFGKKGGHSKTIEIGVNSYPIGNRNVPLDYAPVVVNNHTYVPWQFIEQGLGFDVKIGSNGRVDIKVSKSSSSNDNSSKPDSTGKSVYVNGKKVGSYYNTKDSKGKTVKMIPLRGVVQALGYKYDYSNRDEYSVFSAKGINTHIYWNTNSYPIDNKYQKLEVSAKLKDGTLYVPLSYAQKALKCKTSVSSNGTLKISR